MVENFYLNTIPNFDNMSILLFEMEKALWSIHQLRYRIPEYNPPLTEKLWSEYLDDPEILRLRVKNLLNEIWGENIDDNLKSKILKEKDPDKFKWKYGEDADETSLMKQT